MSCFHNKNKFLRYIYLGKIKKFKNLIYDLQKIYMPSLGGHQARAFIVGARFIACFIPCPISFLQQIIKSMEMNYFSPFYPFAHTLMDGFTYYVPSYPFEQFEAEEKPSEPKLENVIKIEESTQKKERNCSKLLVRIKKLIKQLHREDVLNRKTHWSSEEDQLLRKLVEEEKLEWKLIPQHFRDRTQNMCYSRFRRLQQERKEKRWTRQQEERLVFLVQKHGEKWKRISQELTSMPLFTSDFTPKQIRQRYLNYLRPNIDRSDFSVDEDFKICKFVLENGKHWRRLEETLPGRPEGTIKSRFYAKLQNIIQTAHQDDD